MEKGYRHWGHDIADEDTPLEAGLGFAVRLGQGGGFIGRDALLAPARARRSPAASCSSRSTTRSRCSTATSRSTATGAWSAGSPPARYGHTLGRAVGMGYVAHPAGIDAAFVQVGRWSSSSAMERFPATAQTRAAVRSHLRAGARLAQSHGA